MTTLNSHFRWLNVCFCLHLKTRHCRQRSRRVLLTWVVTPRWPSYGCGSVNGGEEALVAMRPSVVNSQAWRECASGRGRVHRLQAPGRDDGLHCHSGHILRHAEHLGQRWAAANRSGARAVHQGARELGALTKRCSRLPCGEEGRPAGHSTAVASGNMVLNPGSSVCYLWGLSFLTSLLPGSSFVK